MHGVWGNYIPEIRKIHSLWAAITKSRRRKQFMCEGPYFYTMVPIIVCRDG